MRPPSSMLVAAATLVAAASAASHRHITHDSIVISPLTVPQTDNARARALSAGHPAHSLFRRLTHGRDGIVADMHNKHAFVGATDKGFIDVSYEAIVKGEVRRPAEASAARSCWPNSSALLESPPGATASGVEAAVKIIP